LSLVEVLAGAEEVGEAPSSIVLVGLAFTGRSG
jgi:hypothetical protein